MKGAKKDAASQTHVLGKDIVYIKDDIGKLNEKGKTILDNKLFLLLQIFPLLMLAVTFAFERYKAKLSTDVRYARKLKAPKIAKKRLKQAKESLSADKTQDFYSQIFKTLQEYLGHRFNLQSVSMTAEIVDELIEREKLDKKIALQLKQCFYECDIARYAPAELEKKQMQKTLQATEKAIDYLERQKK